ncbi:MAG: hypothetical protein KAS72_12910 [Phycisphaerales bacterium]|nr:hypothetical protein [Phycisphaerales bacterium]
MSVDSRNAEALEPLGTKRKFWYLDSNRQMLFKAEERGTGEDWAEKIACELCDLIGLPHVHYELAYDETGEKPGVVCESCAPPPTSLILGNQLMLDRDPDYPVEQANRYRVREHTVEAVMEIMCELGPPPVLWMKGTPDGVSSALDVFTGYVMLDAWIANQDRHHENWGALRDGDRLALAPTFDHGASMARNLSDEERHERLTTKDRNRHVGPFARRARSALYGTVAATKPLTTVDAWRVVAKLTPEAAHAWLDRLAAIDGATIEALLVQVPPSRMSQVCRDFTRSLLEENQRRLLTEED